VAEVKADDDAFERQRRKKVHSSQTARASKKKIFLSQNLKLIFFLIEKVLSEAMGRRKQQKPKRAAESDQGDQFLLF